MGKILWSLFFQAIIIWSWFVAEKNYYLCDYTNQRERNLDLTRIWCITDEYSNKFEEFGWSCWRKQWLQERNYNLLFQIEFQLFICSISGI